MGRETAVELLVQRGTNDGDHKMGEVGSAFNELEPADNAVIGEILGHARFGDAQMFRELRLQRIDAATARTATQKVSNGDAQSLASLNVVVAGEIGISKDKHA